MPKTAKGEKHFTASAWILSKSIPKKIILVHHKKHNKWLQPGGHIEKFENPVEAVIREVKEETGLDINFLRNKIDVLSNADKFLPIPDFLQEQNIPSHGDEPQHFHLDINYVVEVEEQELKQNKSELNDIGWFTKKEALKLSIHENTRIILSKIL
ncbi:MAG TPA: NUDIX hydrolase [Candidatus Limnocylindrales bacterium]|nr:NUDIX hydrolase [Candidatus Limnocylindrales bacterium]